MSKASKSNKKSKNSNKVTSITPDPSIPEMFTLFFEIPATSKKLERFLRKFFLPTASLLLFGLLGFKLITEYIPTLINRYSDAPQQALQKQMPSATSMELKVENINGNAWRQKDISTVALLEDSVAYAGDTILTGESSSLTLTAPDNTKVSIYESSNITVEAVRSDLYRMVTQKGTMDFNVPQNEDRKVYVDAAGVILESYGGEFALSNLDEISVFVYAGEVKLTDKGDNSFTISSMQRWYESTKAVENIPSIVEDVPPENTLPGESL